MIFSDCPKCHRKTVGSHASLTCALCGYRSPDADRMLRSAYQQDELARRRKAKSAHTTHTVLTIAGLIILAVLVLVFVFGGPTEIR